MEKNVGGLDEGIRITLGPLLVVLSIASIRKSEGRSVLALAGLTVGAILIGTGLTKRCPGNSALGRDTSSGTELSEEAREVRQRALQ